ncbi:glycosyltransferase family 2 protein [Ramlibacter tataouinensis]|uniref:glycosyltransferase family 2 protein n=1 Tax=Ramlibacter tataouinensis TaxID=94132 RepID=UPI0022F4020B|nr:glycosyltransferase family 2 protein [Ramlibacter tataouinensis]WBY03397.1 glycosyltransferase family 2 protein [Ramlibacter tataouinensis]
MDLDLNAVDIAVVIPCYNEEVAIGRVVSDFRRALPAARIHVYDNASSDRTAAVAAQAGAIVGHEPFAGKGNVMRRMFSDIDADVFVLVDGDDTYCAADAPKLVRTLLDNQLDMVNGARITEVKEAYRFGHRFGNRLLTGLVQLIFGRQFEDMLSGYRVFSRRFVKSFPATSSGFEIETELTVHALELRMKTAEVPTRYKERPEGSASKLNTIRDGLRILRMIALLVKEERPLAFFGTTCILLALLSVGLSVPIVLEWLRTGLVPRFPTAILSVGLMLMAALSLVCGLILDTVTHSRRELKRLAYLDIPAPRWPGGLRDVHATAGTRRRPPRATPADSGDAATLPPAPLVVS